MDPPVVPAAGAQVSIGRWIKDTDLEGQKAEHRKVRGLSGFDLISRLPGSWGLLLGGARRKRRRGGYSGA